MRSRSDESIPISHVQKCLVLIEQNWKKRNVYEKHYATERHLLVSVRGFGPAPPDSDAASKTAILPLRSLRPAAA